MSEWRSHHPLNALGDLKAGIINTFHPKWKVSFKKSVSYLIYTPWPQIVVTKIHRSIFASIILIWIIYRTLTSIVTKLTGKKGDKDLERQSWNWRKLECQKHHLERSSRHTGVTHSFLVKRVSKFNFLEIFFFKMFFIKFFIELWSQNF